MTVRKRPIAPRNEYAMRYYASATYRRACARERRRALHWPMLILAICCGYAVLAAAVLATHPAT